VSAETSEILMVGDVILDEPDADSFFVPSRERLARGDVVIGHIEVPHTARGSAQSTDIPAPPADPKNLQAFYNAGFRMATLAGNHINDSGPAGIEDTVATLRGLGIVTTGAGNNLAEAKAPAILERKGTRVGLLSYNCVGPRESWATSAKAGCAYVKVLTHYELDYAAPGGPPTIYTFAAEESLEAMCAEIHALRQCCDIAVVALHKGMGHTPAQIVMYERSIAKAAIDAGADVVIGHHAHILRGIEIYHGKPIYHGLGNFVTVTKALSTAQTDSPERLAWALRREKLFGFKPDPTMPTYPFHPESRNTIIARCAVTAKGLVEAGFIPCYIDQLARPQPLQAHNGGQAVVDYVAKISAAAGLAIQLEWIDDWVAVRAA